MNQSEITAEEVLRRLLRERAAILGYVSSILGDPHSAEDVFQEVCVVAMEKHGQLTGWDHFGPWLRKVARFEALAALRKLKKSPPLFDESLLDLLDDHWARYDAESRQQDRATAIRDCLKTLSPYAQKLLRLRYEDGISGEALAAKVQRKVHAVYVALTRAHKAVGECVERRLATENRP